MNLTEGARARALSVVLGLRIWVLNEIRDTGRRIVRDRVSASRVGASDKTKTAITAGWGIVFILFPVVLLLQIRSPAMSRTKSGKISTMDDN